MRKGKASPAPILRPQQHLPDRDNCNSNIVSAEGPLPIGAQTWQCAVDGKFVDGSLSVTVLVRPFFSLMPSG